MQIQMMYITPELAKSFLEKNSNNRDVKPTRVAKYVKDMKAGQFIATGSAISFFEDGSLADGQHRLLAIIESEVTLHYPVAFGVSKETAPNIDTGATRTAGDVLSMFENLKQDDATTISSAVRIISLHDAGHHYGATAAGGRGKTNREIQEYFIANKESLSNSLNWLHTKGKYKNAVIARGWQVALHYMFSRVNPELAEDYLEKIVHGNNIGAGSTESHVREFLIRDMMSNGRKLQPKAKLYTIVKAFNSLNKGSGIKHASNISWNPSRDSETPVFVKA